MQQPKRKRNPNTVNLIIDSVIFVAFLIATAPHFSGTPIHEWLSIAWAAAIIVHLLLHWQWIIGVAKRFFRTPKWSSRVNYVLNTALFIDATILIFTGLMISETALPLLGISISKGGAWHQLHTLSSNVALVLVGLHIALNWQWIVTMIRRLVIAPFFPGHPVPMLTVNTTAVDEGE